MRQLLLLSSEKTLAYFKEQLESGYDLAKYALNHLDLAKGNFYAFLPPDVDQKKLYSFEVGEIIPPGLREPIHVEGLGTFSGVWIDNASDALCQYLIMRMMENQQLSALFEDIQQEPSDPHVDLFHSHGVSCGNHIYYLVNQKNITQELLEQCIAESHTAWYFLCILSEISFEECPGKEASSTKLKAAGMAAKIVIVGAYDGEGYVIWEKAV